MNTEYNCAQIEAWLTALLSLSRRPVGVRLIGTEEEFTAINADMPRHGLPYCTAVSNATRGKAYKLDVLHNRCVAASTALGMYPVTEHRISGRMHVGFGVYKNIDVSRSVAEDMVYCPNEHHGALIEPLGECLSNPDVVIIAAQPNTVMRIIQGYAYHFGQLKGVKLAGMCAICQECTSFPIVRGDMNISMLCSGTRCVGRWGDDELCVGIPMFQLSKVIDGIWNTVDPMEPAHRKVEILERLKEENLSCPKIDLKRNYYSKAYGIPRLI